MFLRRGISFFSLLLCICAALLPAVEIPSYYHSFTLENGLSVFVLEDTQDALVRVELCVRAGHSAQSPDDAGFFALYARLFFTSAADTALKLETAIPGISGVETACLSDSARYRFQVTPSMCYRALSLLAECAAFPSFSDAAISRELSRMKNEVMAYAVSAEGFINSAIDARIFADAPWKHDSGVYPAVFSAVTPFDARSTLSAIAKTRYVPENAALFISGGIGAKEAEVFASRAFASWKRGSVQDAASNGVPGISPNGEKKFVVVSGALSADFNQIVVQYLSPSKIHAALAARSLEFSDAFEKLAAEQSFGIPSPDYAGVSSAHKTGVSRVIVQGLLSAKNNPAEQAALVVNILRDTAREESFANISIPIARGILLDEYLSAFDSPQNLSVALASAWEENAQFFSEDKTITSFSAQEISRLFAGSGADAYNEPFIFLLVHTSVYNRYRTQIERAGYSAITERNASWYTQELYKNASAASRAQSIGESVFNQDGLTQSAELYLKNNSARFRLEILANGIELISHNADERERVTIALEIAGGERASPQNLYGLESVLALSLAQNIREEIAKTVQGRAIVTAETTRDYSVISIECSPQDAPACIAAACESLIFGTITPLMADEAVNTVRYNHRVNAVTSDAQIERAALRLLYKDTADEKLYSEGDDILMGVRFSSILNAYQGFLDASRLRIIVTGKIAQEAARIKQTAEDTFGALKIAAALTGERGRAPLPQFENEKIAVPILRRFLTSDIPIPAGGGVPFLVPTTIFFDPVHIYLRSPDFENSIAPFNALLFELEHIISVTLAESEKPPASSVAISPASTLYPWASLKFKSVPNKEAVLAVLDSAIESLEANLSGENADAYCTGLKSRWAGRALDKTGTNDGMVRLILDGLYSSGKSFQFLENYVIIENTTVDEFYLLLKDLKIHILIATSNS